jgi:hypothetical protein
MELLEKGRENMLKLFDNMKNILDKGESCPEKPLILTPLAPSAVPDYRLIFEAAAAVHHLYCLPVALPAPVAQCRTLHTLLLSTHPLHQRVVVLVLCEEGVGVLIRLHVDLRHGREGQALSSLALLHTHL